MRSRTLAATAAVLLSIPVTATHAAPEPAWRPIDAANTLVIETSKGRVIVELYPLVAPNAVAQVETLARQHFYDGLTFFRVVDGFMDQTGDPLNSGKGASSLPNLKGEFDFKFAPGAAAGVSDALDLPGASLGFVGTLPIAGQPAAMAALTVDGKVRGLGLFCAGAMGMARAQDPDTANSQFFLMRNEHQDLDGKYTPVGRVVVGLDAVRAIKAGEPVPDPQDRMVSVKILADMPEGARPKLLVEDTSSEAFKAKVAATRAAKPDAFDPCAIPIAVRVS